MCIVGLVQTGPTTFDLETIDFNGCHSSAQAELGVRCGNIRQYQVTEVIIQAEPEHTPHILP